VIIAGTIIGVIVLTRDDGGGDGEVFLESAVSTGTDPFGTLQGTAVAVSTTTTSSTATSASVVTQSLSGGQPGLYGGSNNVAVCDPNQQADYLERNPALAQAFVQALNGDPTLRWSGGTQVQVTQIRQYFRELTPVTLMSDTRVTNHGYRNGRPTDIPAVLQAGTAVMVDRYGAPRVKCNCGNPLTRPVATTRAPRYRGPQWPGFNPGSIIVVNQTTVVINIFVLTNTNGPGTIERPAGTTGGQDQVTGSSTTTTTTTTLPTTTPPTAPPATVTPPTAPGGGNLGTGDVRVTLVWNTDADLDLHVIDPTGVEIDFTNRSSPSGGQLDVDKIPDPGDTSTHVENVFWPTGGAPRGTYTAFVRNLGGSSGTSSSYTMDVFVNGQRVTGSSGALADGADSAPVTFSF